MRITFRVAHRLGPWYLVTMHLFDAVLVVDMAVNFCTAYVNKKSVLTYDMVGLCTKPNAVDPL